MNVFVAGASGAIGRPLVAELVRRGHAVTGMTRSDAGATALADLGAAVARVGAFDAPGLEQALRGSKADVVVDELTALPKSPAEMAAATAGDRRLRLEGGGNLLAAARRCGARRYVQQSSGFFLRPGPGLGDESEGLAVDASPRVAASARTYAELEARLTAAVDIEGVAMRYGFFYGPGTWYHPDGASADQVRRGEFPIIAVAFGVDEPARSGHGASGVPAAGPPDSLHAVPERFPSRTAPAPGRSPPQEIAHAPGIAHRSSPALRGRPAELPQGRALHIPPPSPPRPRRCHRRDTGLRL
jgi:nucleoside-diphosphate-sugar epimerase